MSGETVFQRYKESNEDYRYFPEPDIPPFEISDELLFYIRNSMPEQPVERKLRYTSLGLEQEQADIFVEDTQKGDWFDSLIEFLQSDSNLSVKEVVKWVLGDLSGTSEKFNVDFLSLPFDQRWFLQLMRLYYEQKITGTNVKKIIVEEIKNKSINSEYRTNLSPIEIAEVHSYLLLEDDSLLQNTVNEVIQENTKIVEDTRKNPNAIKALVGLAMKKCKGKLNPQKVEECIRKALSL
jgi:aspartyl-tRNA(Asn)/glutamyl-tRNA(Gln) amidotransferase subunit B